MKPIDPNIGGLDAVVYAKDQPQYRQLPARRDCEGAVITCWNMTLMERLRLLFSGNVYVTLLTFNKPLQPMRVELDKPIVTDGAQ